MTDTGYLYEYFLENTPQADTEPQEGGEKEE